MFETKEGLEKDMKEATKNLEESRGLASDNIGGSSGTAVA